MFAITGASGQLGGHVLDALLKYTQPAHLVALARDTSRLADRAETGIAVRAFDYTKTGTLQSGLSGVQRLLLISSSEVGQRETQHKAVIHAAKAAGVAFIAYTSILHADTNPLDLAAEHRATEQALRECGIPHALLRNGWYNENYTADLAGIVAHGTLIGSSGAGRVSAAARRDYAEAAAIVLAADAPETRTYELAGDTGFTQTELAATITKTADSPVVYRDMPEDAYRTALLGFGLPASFAQLLADSSAKAAGNALFDESGTLGRLIGHPTTPIEASIRHAIHR